MPLTINLYSKPYKSNGGFPARMWYCYSIGLFKKNDFNKRWGYSNMYYDGYFHFFGLGIFELFWCARPDQKYIGEHWNDHPHEYNQGKNPETSVATEAK